MTRESIIDSRLSQRMLQKLFRSLPFFVFWFLFTFVGWIGGRLSMEFFFRQGLYPTGDDSVAQLLLGVSAFPSVIANTVATLAFFIYRMPARNWLLVSILGSLLVGVTAFHSLVILTYALTCLAQGVVIYLTVGGSGLFWLLSMLSQIILPFVILFFTALTAPIVPENWEVGYPLMLVASIYALVSVIALLLTGIWLTSADTRQDKTL
jgi:hypothetical protein